MPLKEIDRDVEVLTASSLLSRLWNIESDIKVMGKVVTENTLALSKIEERIAMMEDKIDGIN
jgi:hypothetical protein